MYLEHFGLKAKPFQISADPRFLWMGSKHKEALAILKYGIFDNRGFLLLSGDVGTGKTTLIHALLHSLGSDTLVAMVPDPGLTLIDFYRYIAKAFHISKIFETKEQFLDLFETFLVENETAGKKVLLVIDEAQRLTSELLEEIRLLSNIEKDYTKLLNIFFVGQNEFNNIILEQRNRPLRQRITINYNIEPLEQHEVIEYIAHRLSVAGCDKTLFTMEAVKDVYAFSEGYPRLINIICDHALLTAFVQGDKQVGDATVRECAEELRIKLVTPRVAAPPGIAPLTRPAGPVAEANMPLQLPTPAPATPPRGLSISTMLVIIFGVLCFVAGLLLFGIRDKLDFLGSAPEARVVQIIPASKAPQSPAAADTPSRMASSPPAPSASQPPTARPPAAEAPAISPPESSVAPGLKETSVTTPSVSVAAAPAVAAVDTPSAAAAPLNAPLPAKRIIYFKIDSNELEDQDLVTLESVVQTLKGRPDLTLQIKGYTDAVGNLHYNLKVSEFRANIVKTFILGQGIAAERIVASGLGSADPVADNDSLEGRQRNRRVEILFDKTR